MGKAYESMTDADIARLDGGNQEEAVKKTFNGKSNPSAADWMLRLSAEQDGRELTEEDLVAAFEDWTWMGQLEQGGNTSYKHYQIFMQAKSRVRLSSIRARLEKKHGIHVGYIEPRRYSVGSCVAYVSKDTTRLAGPFVHGEIDLHEEQGKRSDLEELRDAILKEGLSYSELLENGELSSILSSHLQYAKELWSVHQKRQFGLKDREVKVTYLWGAPGVGKTRKVMSDHDREDVYRVTNYKHPWDEYEGEPVLVLDEYNSQLDFQFLLNVLDRYPLRLPCRYADRYAGWTEVWIVSNKPLSGQYIYEDEASRPALDRRIGEVIHMDKKSVLDDLADDDDCWL